MDYKAVLKDLRNATLFVRPLAKVVEHLEFLGSLEVKEQEILSNISIAENTKRIADEQAEQAGQALLAKKESCSAEIRKINDRVSADAAEHSKILKDQIDALKAEVETLEKNGHAVRSTNSALAQEKKLLENDVAKLKAALSASTAAVGGV